jgi:membrane fusion protein, multidrug efflux system
MGRRAMRRWLGVTVFLALGGVGAAALQGTVKPDAGTAPKKAPAALEFTSVDIVRLTPRLLSTQLLLPGTLQAVSQATVRSKVSAEVRRVAVREGDRVRAGEIVVELDTAQLRMQLAERQAALESARAQLAQTERIRQVNAQLVKQNFISQNAFDAADAAQRSQAAAVAVAQAQLEQTRLQLSDAQVRAPIAGLVAKRHVQPGEKVAYDAPLVSIVDLARLEIQAQAAVSEIARVSTGMPAEVEIEGLAERRFVGRVERINPSAEPGSRTINVYVSLANEDALLRAGMFARVRLRSTGENELPSLPASALQDEAGQAIVWLIVDGRLIKRTVTVGRRDEQAQHVEILSGLNREDRVLATKFDNLRDGLAARILGGVAPPPGMAEKDAPRHLMTSN